MADSCCHHFLNRGLVGLQGIGEGDVGSDSPPAATTEATQETKGPESESEGEGEGDGDQWVDRQQPELLRLLAEVGEITK